MNEHIQDSVKKAKASTFSQLLTDNNSHILDYIIRPYNQRFRELAKDNSEIFKAMNTVMEFVLRLKPFPTVPEHIVYSVARQLRHNSNDFCQAEAGIAATSQDEKVNKWGEQVIFIQVLFFDPTIPDNDEMTLVIDEVLWGIFSCLRQAPRN